MSGPEYPSLLPLVKCSDSVRKVGGKAIALARLARLGVRVPETWVLDAGPFREMVELSLPPGHDPYSLLRLPDARVRIERAARARDRLLEAALGADLEAALAALFAWLAPRAPWGLSVRPSATCEDDSVAKAAGLSGALLGVSSAEALVAAVKLTWGGVYLPSTLDYFMHRRLRDLAVAVLIQPVVRADVSGTLSTRAAASALSPSARTGELLVNAAYGLSPLLVGGDAAVDVIRLTPAGEVVSAIVADKPRRVVLEGGELREVPVTEGARSLALGPSGLEKLARLAAEVSAGPGEPSPCDLAFAFEAGEPWVLTAQPLPSVGYPEGGDAQTVWSRATLTESLSGVVSPLTRSLTEPFVEADFRRTFQRLGCTVPREARLVSSVQGRAYLNLSALMRIAVQLPGISPGAVVQMSGAEGLEVLEQQVEGVSRRSFYSRLPFTVARQLAEQSGLSAEVEAHERSAAEARRALAELDLAILPDDALLPTLREVRALLGRTTALFSACTTAYVTSHLGLKAVLAREFPVTADRIAQAVTAGVPGLESTRLALALARVAEIARDEPGPRAMLARLDPAHAPLPADLPAGPTRRALARLLEEHGHNAIGAAELLTPRFEEEARPLVGLLAALVEGLTHDGTKALSDVRARADRERAFIEHRLSLVDRAAVRALVERTRHLTELRERARGWLLRVLSMLRSVALEVDRRMRRVSPELAPGAAFYCTFDELLAAVSTGRPDLGHVVRLRMVERARDVAHADPPSTFVGAPPPVVLPPSGEAVLRGVPAGFGVVTGRARVVRGARSELSSLRAGEILVIKSADLGLSPLFLVAAGVVTELGGRLTQGSVIAREVGVPAVAHVPSATRVIRTGDRLRLDGDEGVVERLDPG